MGGFIMVDTPNQHESIWDLLLIWIGAILGHLTLSSAVLWATLIYTLFKLYVLIRDEIFSRNKKKKRG
jgi:hypothetical protein